MLVQQYNNKQNGKQKEKMSIRLKNGVEESIDMRKKLPQGIAPPPKKNILLTETVDYNITV